MENVGIYVRVSTLEQSYDRQVADITRYINRQYGEGNVNIEIFNEKISGYKQGKKRPQLDALISKFRNDLTYYSCIYVTELSRLGRNPTETRVLVNELLENKIDICVTSSNGGTHFLTADKKINKIQLAAFQLMMEFADIEADQFKTRSASGRRNNILRGGAAGGTYKPYGYASVDKMMVVDETEAVIVREVFEDYKDGLSMYQIATKLNENNIPTKSESMGKLQGIEWDATQIKRILENELYIGIRSFKKYVTGEATEQFASPELAIVDVDLFEQCKAIRLGKKGNGRNLHTKNVILLQYLMKCGCCGRNFSHRVSEETALYLCTTRLIAPFKSCGNTGININILDSAIYDIFCKTPAMLKYLGDTEKIKEDVARKIELIEMSLPVLEKDFVKYENRLSRLINDYYDEKVPQDIYENKLKEFKSEKANISNQIENQKKQLKSNKKTLVDLDKPATNTQILIDAKNDRNKLKSIFKSIIRSVEVIGLSPNLVKCTVKFHVGDIEVPNSLVIVLRKREYRANDYYSYQTFLIVDAKEPDKETYLNVTDWKHVTENKLKLEYHR
ncbi:recombinase family protein [Flavobacterium daemonense]|uniref:recombinase family protein n=1 Tax=Flavobacterium daemonense TaxID=1393049 RepID=UPI00118695A6|nr:recombinase family protein [Flavobacterium daemonense]KAF2337199.1 recombinase family protein [Flavobacterium daemonense]